MIDGIRFRHIRIKTQKEGFVKIKKKFYSFKELLSFLDKVDYKDAYYSTAYYLNPEKVGIRDRKAKIGEEVWLKSDLVFDIDIDKKNIKEVIRKGIREVKEVLKLGEEKKLKLNYIAFSGSKGFHVVFEDPLKYREAYPAEREERAKQYREELAKEVKNISIDEKVLLDTRRIIRIPFTYNSKTDLMCFPIERKELEEKTIMEKLKKRKGGIIVGAVSLLEKAMRAASRASTIFAQKGKERLRPSVLSLSSTIPGKKRHCLVLSFNSLRKAKQFSSLLKRKSIPHLITKNPLNYQVFSPIAIDISQLVKICKKYSASDLNALKKYNHLLFHIKPTRVIFSFNEVNSSLWYSRGHLLIFERFSEKLNVNEEKKIGTEVIIRKSTIL